MARVKRGVTQHARHKKILKLAKGFHSGRSRLHKTANEAVLHSLDYHTGTAETRSGTSTASGSSASTRPPARTGSATAS